MEAEAKSSQETIVLPPGVKIISGEDFDAGLRANLIVPEQASICTTMPFSRFLSDLNGDNSDTQQWFYQLDVKEVTEGKIFKKTKRVFESHTPSFVKMNRDYYGWMQGFSDVLQEHPEAARVVYGSDYSMLIHLGRKYSEFSPIDSPEKLRALIEANNTHKNGYRPPQERVQASTELALNAFGSIDIIDKVLAEASQRQGVQIVYGGAEFQEWLSQQDVQKGHDSPTHADRRLTGRISARFMKFIIPIGPYEQERLSSEN